MSAPRILLIVQARMHSARFPGKVLASLSGQPMLLRQLDRKHGYDVFLVNVPESDVLLIFAHLVNHYQPEHVIRVTGDCPFIDPQTVDSLIRRHLSSRSAYTGMTIEWGDGNDMEMMTSAALMMANEHASTVSEREHVTPYIYKHPERFKLDNLPCPLDASWLRCSVDTEEDLRIAEYLWNTLTDLHGRNFGWRDILDFTRKSDYVMKYMTGRAHNNAYVDQVANENGVVQSWEKLRYGACETAERFYQ